MTGTATDWILFNVFVLMMLALDLGVFHRKAHVIGFKEALTWTGVWIGLALIFFLGVHSFGERELSLAFLTGYLIEKSLSVDNIFVFLMLFSYFKIPPMHQHKILFWGVLGALVMRAAVILAGIELITRFHWIIYIFGGFLIFTGVKLARKSETQLHPELNPLLRFLEKKTPVVDKVDSGEFFVRERGRLMATPLFICLLSIEASDLIFAVDSIPAVLAITQHSFIVYTSNVFAILGLRSLYFALARFAERFEYLHYGLAAILIFVGTKMLISDVYKIPVEVALGAVAAILTLSVLLSRKRNKDEGTHQDRHDHLAP